MTHKLKVAIRTFGCAMNFYDTEVAEGILENAGYQILRDKAEAGESLKKEGPAEFRGGKSVDHVKIIAGNADVILMNTCSVREHAEERIFGRLGLLGKAKRGNPDLIVGLMGCMVEEHRESLFKRFPQLDLMVGTRNIRELPHLIEQVQIRRKQVSQIKQDGISIEYTDKIRRRGTFHAWLPIMTGCDKVCTFCIVPKTRGSEVSMPAEEVYREAERLVGEGVKWITLLGQNVNSYNGEPEHQIPRAPEKIKGKGGALPLTGAPVSGCSGAPVSFPELLELLCQIKGLQHISFTTSHPQDATREIFETIARNPKISRRFHLPLQSGSDRMLKRMKRLHTYEEYKNKIELLRSLVPGVCITTDIIAGFSGETEEDHQATVRAIKEIRFDGAYIYKYSVRPGTPASKLPDDVPIKIKEQRNAELIALQRKISREINEQLIGQRIEVFVEEASPKDKGMLLGRTNSEKKVIFPGEKALLGTFQRVRVDSLPRDTFRGSLAEAL
jgi:tRNA-2-methylthio-N6-dimethylallyladenosine synthase